jgi:arylesterase / paraoxonase
MVGFDILETSPGNILIYAINHRRTGSTIERFRHTIGTTSLVYEQSFDCNNDIIFAPNDVAVVGVDEFYVTNVLLNSTKLIVGPCGA